MEAAAEGMRATGKNHEMSTPRCDHGVMSSRAWKRAKEGKGKDSMMGREKGREREGMSSVGGVRNTGMWYECPQWRKRRGAVVQPQAAPTQARPPPSQPSERGHQRSQQ